MLNNTNDRPLLEVVVNPYHSTDSKMRKGVLVRGEWQDSYSVFCIENNIEAVYLNTALGFKGEDFIFLENLSQIKELNIIAGTARNLESIGQLTSLEEISLSCHSKSEVEVANLTHLKKVFLNWWPGARSFLENKCIEILYIDAFEKKYQSAISQLTSLQELTIGNSPIDSIEFLGYLNLRKFELLNCKKIMDFSIVSQQVTIEWLAIRGYKNINSIDFLPNSENLEVLLLSDCGSIATINGIETKQNLRAFAFDGNTNILDGNLSPLLKLPKLAMLMFQPRKHYSHKLLRKWNWDNFHYPENLLAKK